MMLMDERQRAMDALGDRFDLVDFHHAILRHGGIPLFSLRTIVDRYIIETFFGFNCAAASETAP